MYISCYVRKFQFCSRCNFPIQAHLITFHTTTQPHHDQIQFTLQTQHPKHEYQPLKRSKGFDRLAAQYNIPSGGGTIKRWYDQWDGTAASLDHQSGAGRPTILNKIEIKQHILVPIRRSN